MKKQSKIFIPKQENLKLLSHNQRLVFENLGFTSKYNLYLAGGTALIFYLGHRTSLDFDFYTGKEFEKGEFLKIFKNELENKKLTTKVLRDFKNTFELLVNNVHLSCFYYPYPLIGKLKKFNNILIASIQDISAMKALAIGQRGTKRDFIDIYYLIKIFGLRKILFWAKKKYPEYSEMVFLKGLVYFDDAEKEEERNIKIIDKSITWNNIKKEIIDAVRKYQLNLSKKFVK
jgi:predicted nucleotidyltransferase component of viral defense system